MKKSLLTLFAVVTTTAWSQVTLQHSGVSTVGPKNFTPPNVTNVQSNLNDTLEYFYNKNFFKNQFIPSNPQSPNLLFYTVKTPYTSNTLKITHAGSIFNNTANLTVFGLQGIVIKETSAPTASVAVKLYLCNLNINNLPVLPAIDSVATTISNSTAGDWVGGNFNTPHVVNGKYAVLFKIDSPNPQDTIRLFMNNACTPTSTYAASQKFGESLGVMRVNGAFQSNTNTFGTGTDYEFIVAPRVTLSYTSMVQPITNTTCVNSQGTFSNISTFQQHLENRQMNFNWFYKYWQPWSLTTNSLINNVSPDSTYNWFYSGASTGSNTTKHGAATFTLAGVQTASLFTLYRQSFALGNHFSLIDIGTGTINVSSTFAPSLSVSGNTVICAGNTTTLTASGNPTFTWNPGGSNNAVLVVTPNSTSMYTVTGSANGCTGINIVTVQVTSQPTVTISGPASICENKSFTMSATGAMTYTWSNGSQAPTVTIVATGSGNQTYSIQGANGNCPPGFASKNINVNAAPAVSLVSPLYVLCTKATGGESVSLSGSPTGGKYTGASLSSLGIFSPNTTGTFISTYSYTDALTTCAASSTAALVVVNCSGVEEQNGNPVYEVYPNPASQGLFTVAGINSLSTLEIYNVAGTLISRQQVSHDQQIDISTHPAGIYLVRISNGSRERTLRVVNGN